MLQMIVLLCANQDKVITTQPIITKLSRYISLFMLITCEDIRWILHETFFLPNFLWKFWICFFKVKHSIGYISGIMKEVHRLDTWWNLWHRPLTSTITLTFDFFQGQISKELYLRSCYLIVVKQKEIKLIRYWAYPWSCPLTTSMTLTLKFKGESLKQPYARNGGGRLIDMERKGCESIIHNCDRDLWVIMLGWVDVPDGDGDDFKCCNAVNISSFMIISLHDLEETRRYNNEPAHH